MGDYIVSLTQRTDFLEELPASLLEQGLLLERLGKFKMPAYDGADPDRREEILSQLLSFLEEAQTGEWAELETGQSDSQAEGTEQDKKNLRSLLDLKSWMDRGILHLVLPDGASLSEAELSGALLRRPREEETPALIQAYRNLLYGEYALRYTADYTEDTDGAGLIYETEYLIVGGDSDQANPGCGCIAASAGSGDGQSPLSFKRSGQPQQDSGNCRGNRPGFGRACPSSSDYGFFDGALGFGRGCMRCANSACGRQSASA